jgi:hypothetical protein
LGRKEISVSNPIAQRQAEIRRLVARADELSQQDGHDFDAWDALHEAIEALDAHSGPGLAVGRQLHFNVADGVVFYIVDRIEESDPHRVHCAWIANSDGYEADAVDSDGYCLRSIAERQLRRREGW